MRATDIEAVRTALVVAGIATPDQGRTFIEAMRLPPQRQQAVTTIWTDGACAWNPGGGGGYAAIIVPPEGPKQEIVGGELSTTSNRMELRAVIEGLRALPPTDVMVFSDSQYVVKGCMSWLIAWKRNGWQTQSKREVINRDLWEQIDAEMHRHTRVEAKWLRGHSGNPHNDDADALAEAEARRQEELAEEEEAVADGDMPQGFVTEIRAGMKAAR